jgi:multidrug efflux pump subunit AcrB
LYRTDAVARRVISIARQTPGIAATVAFVGFSAASRTDSSTAAGIFTPLEDASERASKGLTAERIIADLRRKLSEIQEAEIVVIPPPPVPGIGTAGGFKMQLEDRSGLGLQALAKAANAVVVAANKEAGLAQVYSTFRVNTPQIYLHIDRSKASMLHVPLGNVFETLQVYLGSLYVNDFNFLGKTFHVTAQAESAYRAKADDIPELKTRSDSGAIVPLGSLVHVENRTGPDRVVRYNLYPAADVSGSTRPGFSSGQSLDIMEHIARQVLPAGMAFEWTDLAYQERLAGNVALYIFPLCVLFVFLTLSAQYESWVLPFGVILIVPMCLLFAIAGVLIRGMENNILTQIGFVVLVGLACKNAILIVQFAKAEEDKGNDRYEAVAQACLLRLRPILMTSFAFIFGVIPLVIAQGAGYEMRQAVGTAVFSGMLGVSFFGLFLTPVFYVALSRLMRHRNIIDEPSEG